MGADFDLSKAGREVISEAMKRDYSGPEGARLRHIASINGHKAAGWGKRMKVGESRLLLHKNGKTLVNLKRVA